MLSKVRNRHMKHNPIDAEQENTLILILTSTLASYCFILHSLHSNHPSTPDHRPTLNPRPEGTPDLAQLRVHL